MKQAALFVLTLLCLTAAKAQDPYRGGIEFGFGINGGRPVGNDLKYRSNYGIGADASLGFNFTKKYALLVKGGYISFITKDNLSADPVNAIGDGFIKVCGRDNFISRFYIEPEFGFTRFSGGKGRANKINGNGLTYALAAGAFLDKNKAFDVSLRYEATISHEAINFLGLRVAYSIKPGTYW